jgi:O-antigen/teichoic acid export membrane protein
MVSAVSPLLRMTFGRRVATATGSIALANGLARLVAIAAAPILTRLLGPAAYGVAAIVGTFSALLGTVALLGIDMSYARFFFGGVGASGTEVERFCWRASIAAAIAASLLGIVLWAFVMAPLTANQTLFGVAAGASGLLTVIGTMAQTRLRLQGRYSRLAAALVLSGSVSTGLAVLLAHLWRTDAWALLLGAIGGGLASLALLGMPSLAFLSQTSGLGKIERRQIIALGIPGAGTALMYWAISSFDRWVIASFHGNDAVGLYTFAASIGLLGLMLNSAIVTVWFPEASRTFEQDKLEAPARLGRLWTQLVVALGLVWLAVSMGGGDIVRFIADPRFHAASSYIPWIAGSAFFYGVAQLSGTGLVLAKDMRPIVRWWFAGSCLSIVLNLTFVNRFGALASAITMCGSFAFIALGVMTASQQRLALTVSWMRVLPSAILIVPVGLLGALPWHDRPLVSIALKLPVGLVVVAALGMMIASESRTTVGNTFYRAVRSRR